MMRAMSSTLMVFIAGFILGLGKTFDDSDHQFAVSSGREDIFSFEDNLDSGTLQAAKCN